MDAVMKSLAQGLAGNMKLQRIPGTNQEVATRNVGGDLYSSGAALPVPGALITPPFANITISWTNTTGRMSAIVLGGGLTSIGQNLNLINQMIAAFASKGLRGLVVTDFFIPASAINLNGKTKSNALGNCMIPNMIFTNLLNKFMASVYNTGTNLTMFNCESLAIYNTPDFFQNDKLELAKMGKTPTLSADAAVAFNVPPGESITAEVIYNTNGFSGVPQ